MKPLFLTDSITQKVFFLRHGQSFGSGFVIDFDGRQYLITARHIVEDILADNRVSIHVRGEWYHAEVNWIEIDSSVDAIVLVFSRLLTKGSQFEPGGSYAYGQDVYFLGFPFGWNQYLMPDQLLPIPFAKKGIVAGWSGDEKDVFYIDGQSNSGFSGGPVVTIDAETGKPCIIGLVHGSVMTVEPVSPATETDRVEQKGEEHFVNSDAGIVKAFGLTRVLKAIKQNPVGCPIN
jgi:hypothetical protein